MAYNSRTAKLASRHKKKKDHPNSLAYKRKRAEHYHIPLNLEHLGVASHRHKVRLKVGEVLIYDELRPVKIIAGFNDDCVIVQFLDRVDTPVRKVDPRKLWCEIPYGPEVTAFEKEMTEAFSEFAINPTPVDAFEDGWW